MRLKDVTEFCPAYTGAARNDAVAFVPMEALRYDSIAQQEIPFEEARGKYTFFADGDLLFAKVTPCFENGNIAIANNLKGGIGFGSSEIFVLRAKPGLNNRYLFYVVQASPFMDGGCATMCGVGGLKRMSPLFPRTFEWEIPSEESQRKIVAYLDEKSASIDGRVAVLEKKLAAYKRLKASVINRAVTRGLDPKAKLKDSGASIIEKMPIGWSVRQLKSICTMAAGDNIATEAIGESGAYPVYGGNGQRGWYDKYNFDGTTVIVGRQGALAGNVHFVQGKIWATEHAVITRCSHEVSIKYLHYNLGVMKLNRLALKCAAQPGLSVSDVLNQFTVLPPLPEQRAIADYLDAECAKIDKMAELVTREIELYKRLKRSLINEVVTGKRPVFADKPRRRGKEVA